MANVDFIDFLEKNGITRKEQAKLDKKITSIMQHNDIVTAGYKIIEMVTNSTPLVAFYAGCVYMATGLVITGK